MNINDIKAALTNLAKEGKTIAYIRAFLTLEGIEGKEATDLLKDLGISRTNNGATYPDILNYLSEEPRTEKEFYEYVLVEGTKNEARWINDRNKIRIVLNKVYVKNGIEFKEESASDSLKKEVKEKSAV